MTSRHRPVAWHHLCHATNPLHPLFAMVLNRIRSLCTVHCTFYIFFALLPFALFADSSDKLRSTLSHDTPLITAESPLQVRADTNTFDNAKQIWIGDGNVHIQNDAHQLHADHVTVNYDTGDIFARGNITLARPDLGTWSGQELDYNYHTRVGLIGPSQFKGHGATINAGQILSSTNNIIVMRDAQFTTCTNSPGHWHYHLNASRLTYNNGQSVSFHHASAWFLGLPVGYFPYWYRDLDGYGIRLTPGYTSDWGAFLLGSYLYKIRPSDDPLHNINGRFHLDYRTERGGAIGNDFSWHSPTFGVGSLSLYFLHDLDPPQYGAFDPLHQYDRVQTDRYRIAFQNILTPTDHDRIITKAETLSDSLLLYDFFEDNFRTYFQPDNLASYTHTETDWATGLTLSGPVDSFYDGIARLPEAWLNLPATPLGLGLFYETQSRVGYYHTAFSNWARDLGVHNYAAARLDTYHRLTLPLTLGPSLPVALTPRAAWRGTWYSATSKLQPDGRYANSSDDGMRNLYELGVDLSTKFYGDLNDGKLLHILQPYAGYTYIPSSKDLDDKSLPGNSARYPYGFDRYDNYREWRDLFGFDNAPPVSQWHGFRLGARNLFQTGEPGKRRTLLDTDLYAAYIIDSDATSTGWGLLGTRTRFAPYRNLGFSVNADYDPKDSVLRYLDLSADWTWSKYSINAGWLRRHDPVFADTFYSENSTGIVYARYNQAVTRAWGWGLEGRYNTEEKHIDEVAGTLSFRIDCMTFQVRTAYEPSYTSDSGIHQDSDFKISFLIRLNPAPDQSPPELANGGVTGADIATW